MTVLIFVTGVLLGSVVMMVWLATGPTVSITFSIKSDPEVV